MNGSGILQGILATVLGGMLTTAAVQASDLSDWAKKEDWIKLSVPVNGSGGLLFLTVGRNEIAVFGVPNWHKVAARRYDFLGMPSVSPDGRRLAIQTFTGEEGKAKKETLIFNLADLSIHASLPEAKGLAPKFCTGNVVVLEDDQTSELDLWRVAGAKPEHLKPIVVKGAARVDDIRPILNGSRLVISADRFKPAPVTPSARPVNEKPADIYGHLPPPHWGKFVQIWNMQTMSPVGDVVGGTVGKDEAWDVVVSPDSQKVAVLLGDGFRDVRSIAFLDADSGKIRGERVTLPSKGKISDVKFSEDSNELLARDADGNDVKWPVP